VTLRAVPSFRSASSSKVSVTALASLCSFSLLALVVAHGRGPYGFEDPVFKWLGAPSVTAAWANFAELLAAPAIGAALFISLAIGIARGALFRVVVYAAIATSAFLISEHIAKPLIQRSYYGELTFPSGSVTAVSATALAMWIALYPLLGRGARLVVLVVGAAWTLLTALAVVGALWHTPLDDLGSMLLSVGIVTGGAVVVEHAAVRRPPTGAEHPMVGEPR
jgi:hypothetical protein